MNRSNLRFIVFIGAMVEIVLFFMAFMGFVKHPVFTVLLAVWAFLAGVALTKYKELYHG